MLQCNGAYKLFCLFQHGGKKMEKISKLFGAIETMKGKVYIGKSSNLRQEPP